MRIGIGHPGRKEAVLGYVLHAFAKSDRDWLDPLLDAIADDIETMAAGQSELFMTKVAARLAPPKPATPPKPHPAKAPNEAP